MTERIIAKAKIIMKRSYWTSNNGTKDMVMMVMMIIIIIVIITVIINIMIIIKKSGSNTNWLFSLERNIKIKII